MKYLHSIPTIRRSMVNILKLLIVFLSIFVSSHICVTISQVRAQTKAETDEEKILYSFGYDFARRWRSFGFSKTELKLITQGIIDAALNLEPKTKTTQWKDKIQPLLFEKKRRTEEFIIKQQTVYSTKLLEEESKVPNAMTMPSGLIITQLKPGTGPSPKATSRVTVHYHGTLGDGTVFDSSLKRGRPVTFSLNKVIKCWKEALQLMKVGSKSRLVCPADLAYGNNSVGSDILPATALIFEVELIAFN
ncbi:MAG: Outer membrane protein MIP [Hyphomicrobiaceae bacterium hypho_1]